MLNQKGSALITGMIAALSVGVVSAIILQQSQVTDKQTRIPRIKSSMMMVETQLNEALNQSVIIQPCVSGVPGCFEPNHAALDAMRLEIPGAQCETPPCGVSIEDRNFVGGVFTARIIYNGTEVSIAPVNISLAPSQNDAWTTVGTSCPDSEPLLMGFNPDGSRICRALPVDCGPGMYVSNIDPMSLTSGGVTCTAFPTNVTCGPNQIMVGFTWTGGPGGGTPQCANLSNPFAPTVLNDPTTYSYSPPVVSVVTVWPTTTVTPMGCWSPLGGEDGSCSGEPPFPMVGGGSCNVGELGCNQMTRPNGTIFRRNAMCVTGPCGPVANTNGACGSADGTLSIVAPSANLCSVGSSSTPVNGADWTWSCFGSGTGTNDHCSAPKTIMAGSCNCPDAAYAGGAYFINTILGAGTQADCMAFRATQGNPASWNCQAAMSITAQPPGWDCYILIQGGPALYGPAGPMCDPFPPGSCTADSSFSPRLCTGPETMPSTDADCCSNYSRCQGSPVRAVCGGGGPMGACIGCEPGNALYNGSYRSAIMSGSQAACTAALASSPPGHTCVQQPAGHGGPNCYVLIDTNMLGTWNAICN